MSPFRTLSALAALFGLALAAPPVVAQSQPLDVECGSIIDGTAAFGGQEDIYRIELATGDLVEIEYTIAIPGSPGLNVYLHDTLGASMSGVPHPDQAFVVQIPFAGTHEIRVRQRDGLGSYTLSIGCTIAATGEVIEPGDAPPVRAAVAAGAPSYPNLAPTTFDGFVDFPLPPDAALPALFAPGGQERYAFRFEGAVEQAVTIQVSRTAGNLAIGLVVTAPGGRVVFYGGLIDNQELTTRLTLALDGTYTVALFQSGLTSADAAQPTVVQVLVAQD